MMARNVGETRRRRYFRLNRQSADSVSDWGRKRAFEIAGFFAYNILSFIQMERKMPSFDIVSKTDMTEMANAVAGVSREMSTRFDFKGSKSSVELNGGEIVLLADDALKLKQVRELVLTYVTRRKLDTSCLDFGKEEKAAGAMIRQTVRVKQGIDQETAKKISKAVKDSKMKVQIAIQGDELRVSGKKRDDLQAAIAFVKTLGIPQPLQFVNFRD